MDMRDFDREDMVRVGGVWVCERDIPDAAELAEMREERRAEDARTMPQPGDTIPDECPW
jgi:hypothetical protein